MLKSTRVIAWARVFLTRWKARLVHASGTGHATGHARGLSPPESVAPGHPRWDSCRGFTLIELIVVLLLLGLAAALAAPVFMAPREDEAGLAEVVRGIRRLAERRGETLYLDMGPEGRWAVIGSSSPEEGTLVGGELEAYAGPAFRLVLSPIGACALDVRSSRAASTVRVDPLTCEVEGP